MLHLADRNRSTTKLRLAPMIGRSARHPLIQIWNTREPAGAMFLLGPQLVSKGTLPWNAPSTLGA